MTEVQGVREAGRENRRPFHCKNRRNRKTDEMELNKTGRPRNWFFKRVNYSFSSKLLKNVFAAEGRVTSGETSGETSSETLC